MTEVVINPMPERFKKTPMLYRPRTHPIFYNIDPGGIIEKDRQLARELFLLLDDESKAWYLYNHKILFGNL